MTKKHYEMIARRVNDAMHRNQALEDYHRAVDEPNTAERYRHAEWEIATFAENLANDLKADNPNFDIDKFRAACRIGGGVTTDHECYKVPEYLRN